MRLVLEILYIQGYHIKNDNVIMMIISVTKD